MEKIENFQMSCLMSRLDQGEGGKMRMSRLNKLLPTPILYTQEWEYKVCVLF